ncbi:MAG: cupin domain-containing protein [Novosphingobium sp.]|nr:cupin domain-containing protein [Novosphingobium sp.]MBO9602944.1 cupin domain-containing protein [Novosphingobium sp.]
MAADACFPAFGRFDADSFLRDYWQKRPLLIRNPWAGWRNPLEPDELAGLACEDGVEARLVVHGADGWSLEHGPIPEDRFGELGTDPWTLLVQAVDQHVPEVAALIEPFRFVPDWRIDDVMVSYASDGGGVGPHFDRYDVFLVQGLGRRRWRVGGPCDEASELLPHGQLRLLARLDPIDEWVLEPGDILYLPPGIAHDGIAVGDDCMTYSVGFRAPSRRELLAGWAEGEPDLPGEDERYEDPDLVRQANPGEIAASALDRLYRLAGGAGERAEFARWFGEYASTPKYPEIDWRPEEPLEPGELRALAADGVPLARNPASRFCFLREGSSIVLFADGVGTECRDACAAFAERLCAETSLVLDPAAPEAVLDLVADLVNQGCLAFDEDG